MGFYLELQPQDMAMQLKRDHDAQLVLQPRSFDSVPQDKTLICVVENGYADAAGIVFDQAELERFAYDGTSRPRTWLLVDRWRIIQMKLHLADYLRGERDWREV